MSDFSTDYYCLDIYTFEIIKLEERYSIMPEIGSTTIDKQYDSQIDTWKELVDENNAN